MATVAYLPGNIHGSMEAAVAIVSKGVNIGDDYSYVITEKEDVVITITNNTTQQELDQFIGKMKEKGIDLSYDEIDYNSKGKLVSISGHMRSSDGHSNFAANNFEKLCLAMIKKGEKTYFKVSSKSREVI